MRLERLERLETLSINGKLSNYSTE